MADVANFECGAVQCSPVKLGLCVDVWLLRASRAWWSDMARWFLAILLFDVGWNGVLLPVFWLSDPQGTREAFLVR